MRAEAKQRFRQTRPSSCVYCGTWIKFDMYRHVAKFHLDLAQLWRCPVSWCTVWKGTPQDCMDHIRVAHDVPWEAKLASLEQFIPPWTVRRQVWSDSLKQCHSGISTDMLLFSDINLSLIHHYRYTSAGSRISPSGGTICRGCVHCCLPRWLSSAELVGESPRRTRRAKRRMRPVCVMEGSVGKLPVLTIQDPSDVQGAMVYDCRPPLLPVSLQLSDIGPLSGRPTVVSVSVAVPPWEDGLTISGVGSDVLVVPELGLAPLVDYGPGGRATYVGWFSVYRCC